MAITILLGVLIPELFSLNKILVPWNNIIELFVVFGKYHVNDVTYAKDFKCVLTLRTWALIPLIVLNIKS